MKRKRVHPIAEVLLVIILVSLLVLTQFSIMIVTDDSGGDFIKLRNLYESELLTATLTSLLCSVLILYLLIKSHHPIPKLAETTALLSWQYRKPYWEKIKKENLSNISLFGLSKELFSCALVGALAYLLLSIESKTLLISLLSLLIVFSVPVIPFTLGRYIKEKNCQFFKDAYHVSIYRKGLTINNVYFPFHGQSLEIERHGNQLKFIIVRQFNPIHSGGADTILSTSASTKKIHICIPVPETEEVDLKWLRNELTTVP